MEFRPKGARGVFLFREERGGNDHIAIDAAKRHVDLFGDLVSPVAADPERVLVADNFLGGRMSLDAEASARVIGELAERLGRTPEETAEGALTVLNSNMANAIRSRTVQKGIDPREFTLAGYEWGTPERRGAHPWVEQYGERGQGDADEDVMDEPTWSWARRRAEPFYGQDHAALAALLRRRLCCRFVW